MDEGLQAYHKRKSRKAYVHPEVKTKVQEEPEKPKEPEKKEEPKGERVKSEEELADIEELEKYTKDREDIYHKLDTTTRLDPAYRKKYIRELVECEAKINELKLKIEAYGKQDAKQESKPEIKKETPNPKEESKDDKKMPGVEINTGDVEFEENDPDFEEIVEEGGVRTLLPVLRTREDLIAYKKQNMLEKAEKGFVGFTNKFFGRNDNKPPRFISGMIKFALNTRFWVQDRIRNMRDKRKKMENK